MAVNWKLFFVLFGMGFLGMLAAIPFGITVQGALLSQIPLALPLLIFFDLLKGAFILAVSVFVGLVLAKRVGLSMPLLDRWFGKGKERVNIGAIVLFSALVGILVGVLIVISASFVTFLSESGALPMGFEVAGDDSPHFSETPIQERFQVPIWQGFLVSFYGGITEEIFMRLFLLSLIAWILLKLQSGKNKKLTPKIMWIAIIGSAILFGIGHIPLTATLTALTPALILRSIVAFGIAGIFFGWLFWKKGLETAMLTHFSSDIFLYVLLPLIVQYDVPYALF